MPSTVLFARTVARLHIQGFSSNGIEVILKKERVETPGVSGDLSKTIRKTLTVATFFALERLLLWKHFHLS